VQLIIFKILFVVVLFIMGWLSHQFFGDNFIEKETEEILQKDFDIKVKFDDNKYNLNKDEEKK